MRIVTAVQTANAKCHGAKLGGELWSQENSSYLKYYVSVFTLDPMWFKCRLESARSRFPSQIYHSSWPVEGYLKLLDLQSPHIKNGELGLLSIGFLWGLNEKMLSTMPDTSRSSVMGNIRVTVLCVLKKFFGLKSVVAFASFSPSGMFL